MGKNKSSNNFMNPTDRMRRDARKRELKKNKKQRLIIRTSLLKSKDPYQIISELERLDKMEFDYYNPPPLNAKVLIDKRRKLKETWDRVIRLYIKEEKDKFQELKRIEAEYEAKRNELIKNYEAIKSAQEVSLDEIPLPALPSEAPTISLTNPLENIGKPHSILKTSKSKTNHQPPGCPSGLPPSWSDYENEENNDEDVDSDFEQILEKEDGKTKKRISFENKEHDVESKDNLSEFLKEIEQISGDKDKVSESNKTDGIKVEPMDVNSHILALASSSRAPTPMAMFYANRIQPAPPIIPDLPNVRAPPPSFSSLQMSMNSSTSISQLAIRPVHLMPRPLVSHLPSPSQSSTLASGYHSRKPEKPQAATIEARPQLRNLSADTTKFMPLSLRIKRDEKHQPLKKTNKPLSYGMIQSSYYSDNSRQAQSKTNSKDDAYEDFIKEMTGLL